MASRLGIFDKNDIPARRSSSCAAVMYWTHRHVPTATSGRNPPALMNGGADPEPSFSDPSPPSLSIPAFPSQPPQPSPGRTTRCTATVNASQVVGGTRLRRQGSGGMLGATAR